MGLTTRVTHVARGRALDRALDEAALRLADLTRTGVDQLVRLRGRQIAASADAFRLRHPLLDDVGVEEALIRDRRWRGAARGAVSGIPSLLPGAGTAVEVTVAVADAAATVLDQAALTLALCHLRGLDVADVEARRADVLLVLGIESGAITLKDGKLLAGEVEIGRDGVLADEVIARLSRGIGDDVVRRVAKRKAGFLVGRLAPLGVGVAVAAGADYLALRSIARAARRYLAWRTADPARA